MNERGRLCSDADRKKLKYSEKNLHAAWKMSSTLGKYI
jgi:hypothetical protein